jgi:4-hydroxybutyryl-CoA dehydratase/vinylacetyl-CoA-Delta-isomerase
VTYHIAWVELIVGLAAAIADYNGLRKASNVRDQMTELVYYLNTMKSLARASCMDYVIHASMAIPNPVTANVAKYFYANNYHMVTKIVEDLCGGLLTTAPTHADWQNSEIGGFMDRYLGGTADTSAEARLRILQTLRHYPCLGLELDVNNIHAEGSLMAERLTIYSEARQDLVLYKKLAEILSGVTQASWEEYVKLCEELSKIGKGDSQD